MEFVELYFVGGGNHNCVTGTTVESGCENTTQYMTPIIGEVTVIL